MPIFHVCLKKEALLTIRCENDKEAREIALKEVEKDDTRWEIEDSWPDFS